MADTEPRNVFDRAWTDHPQADYMTHIIFLRLVIERPSLDLKILHFTVQNDGCDRVFLFWFIGKFPNRALLKAIDKFR